jgi:prefoldin subunit 5
VPTPPTPPAKPALEGFDMEKMKLELDNINTRLENIGHKFELLSTELDTLHSEEDQQRVLTEKYISLLNVINKKLDTLEKQHEELWRIVKGKTA